MVLVVPIQLCSYISLGHVQMKHFISLKPLDSSRALFSPSPVFLHCVLLHYWVGNNTNLIPKLARGEDQDKSRMSTLTVLAQQKMFLPWGVLFLNGCCTQRVSLLVPFSLWQAGFRGKLPHKKKKNKSGAPKASGCL